MSIFKNGKNVKVIVPGTGQLFKALTSRSDKPFRYFR
jgi:hypothetical protein